jgi:hypothetical protein
VHHATVHHATVLTDNSPYWDASSKLQKAATVAVTKTSNSSMHCAAEELPHAVIAWCCTLTQFQNQYAVLHSGEHNLEFSSTPAVFT